MNKFLLLSIVVLLSSCSTLYRESTYVLDFTKYSKEGFFISPISDGVKYEPISNLTMEFEPGNLKGHVRSELERKNKNKSDDLFNVVVYNETGGNGSKSYFHPTMEYMLDKFVEEAKSQGATGILNFKAIKHIDLRKGTLLYYDLSGFAVKIK